MDSTVRIVISIAVLSVCSGLATVAASDARVSPRPGLPDDSAKALAERLDQTDSSGLDAVLEPVVKRGRESIPTVLLARQYAKTNLARKKLDAAAERLIWPPGEAKPPFSVKRLKEALADSRWALAIHLVTRDPDQAKSEEARDAFWSAAERAWGQARQLNPALKLKYPDVGYNGWKVGDQVGGALLTRVVFARTVKAGGAVMGSLLVCEDLSQPEFNTVADSVVICMGDIECESVRNSLVITAASVQVPQGVDSSVIISLGDITLLNRGITLRSCFGTLGKVTLNESGTRDSVAMKPNELAALYRPEWERLLGVKVKAGEGGVAVIERVAAAPEAGEAVQPGDVIVAVNGRPTPTLSSLDRVCGRASATGRAYVTVRRNEAFRIVTM
jgi:hypothetical protein